MMIRKFVVLGALTVVAIAAAQSVGVQGAVGRGAARNEDGQGGHFSFNVKKVWISNTQSRVTGGFEFKKATNNPAEAWVIGMREARNYEQNGHVAEFGGPAKLMRRTATGPVAIEGRLTVRVADNRAPGEGKSEPDGIRFRFVPVNNADVIEFTGKVVDGDIKVHRRG